MKTKIIFEGKTISEIHYLVRYPDKNDVFKIYKFINELSQEKTYINFQGEIITIVEQKKYLAEQLKRITRKQSVELLVQIDSDIIGASSINLGEGASKTEGELAISMLKNYRNCGIGGKLLDLTIDEVKNLTNLKVITLTLFGNNYLAYDLYKKRGFKEFGRLPKGILYKEKYYDKIYMYKDISEKIIHH